MYVELSTFLCGDIMHEDLPICAPGNYRGGRRKKLRNIFFFRVSKYSAGDFSSLKEEGGDGMNDRGDTS